MNEKEAFAKTLKEIGDHDDEKWEQVMGELISAADQCRDAVLLTPVPEGAEPRLCGDCTECCDALAIEDSPEVVSRGRTEEFSKRQGEPCKELSTDAKGCGIYDRRPLSCRGYSCLWSRGWKDEDARPDRSGYIVDNHMDVEPCMVVSETLGRFPIVFVTEVRKGVFPAKKRFMKERLTGDSFPGHIPELARTHLVMVRWYGDGNPSIMIGPGHLIQIFSVIDRMMEV